MTRDTDRERRLDAILTAAEGDAGAVRAAARQIQQRDGGLAADLRLVAQLHETMPARAEIDAARLRVGQRLTRDIFGAPPDEGAAAYRLRPLRRSEPPETILARDIAEHTRAITTPSLAPTAPGMPPRALYGRRRSQWRRALLATATAAGLFLAIGGGVTAASAQSMPESPLYSIKRAEESILLALPLSDDSRAEALGMVAQRRLGEAQSEASEFHDAEVSTLLNDYSGDMRQLIMLAASVNERGGDDSNIMTQIAKVMDAEQAIEQRAAAQGLTAFSQALSATTDNIAATLKQHHIDLPGANGDNGKDNGKGHGDPPKATPPAGNATPTVGPTPTAPGSGGTHGGSGHGNGNGRTTGDSAG
ncbi:MAG TPA: DUF5667 domain-containing protein [Ktedonobacterales bacterium]|nr:DUF5667 domain-containing protein [Ktedonobacterales bacterium]